MTKTACREIIEFLIEIQNPTKSNIDHFKMQVSGKHNLPKVPSNSELIHYLKADEKDKLLPILRRKVVRTISGVAVVAVMTKPWPCPKTSPCAYCPGGPPYGVPQSYTGHEPATMRGIQSFFDPFVQVKHRIEQLKA